MIASTRLPWVPVTLSFDISDAVDRSLMFALGLACETARISTEWFGLVQDQLTERRTIMSQICFSPAPRSNFLSRQVRDQRHGHLSHSTRREVCMLDLTLVCTFTGSNLSRHACCSPESLPTASSNAHYPLPIRALMLSNTINEITLRTHISFNCAIQERLDLRVRSDSEEVRPETAIEPQQSFLSRNLCRAIDRALVRSTSSLQTGLQKVEWETEKGGKESADA